MTTFQVDNLYFTIISDSEVRTGSQSTDKDSNAIVNKPESFANYQINIPATISSNGKQYMVTVIGIRSFRGCREALFSLPSTITSVEYMGFDQTGMTTFPNLPNLKIIAEYGFASATFTSIELPASLMTIGPAGISYNPYLQAVKIPENSPYFSLDEYGALYNRNKTRLIWVSTSLTNFTIPYTVLSTEMHVFLYTKMSSIQIPPLCTEISVYTFDSSESLKEVFFTGNIRTIHNYCFSNCPNIEAIYFFGVTKIQTLSLPTKTVVYTCIEYTFPNCAGKKPIVSGHCPYFNLPNFISMKKCIMNLRVSSLLFHTIFGTC